ERAEEAVHEAMVRVWTSAHSFRGEGEVRAWLFSIVARESLKTIKNLKRTSAKMDPNVAAENCAIPSSQLEGVQSSELSAALRRQVDSLPPLERQLIGLHFAGGLSQHEISKALSIPQQTISYRI